MTLISRLLGKESVPTQSEASGSGANARNSNAETGAAGTPRDSGVAALEFGDELLRAALESTSGHDQRAAQKHLAELIDANRVAVEQLPSDLDKREAVLATLALCGNVAHFDTLAATVSDQDDWLRLASVGSSAKLRQLAALRVEGEERLRKLLKAARDSDKNVYRVAKGKLDDIHAAAKHVEAERAHMLSLAETIDHHSYKPFDGAFVATLEHLEREWERDWNTVGVEIPDEIRVRVSAAIDRARHAITSHIRAAGAQAARESAIANAGPLREAVITDLKKLLAALYSATAFETADAEGVTARLAKSQERWNDTLQYKPASREERTQFERLLAAAQKLTKVNAASGTLHQQTEAAAAAPSHEAYARIESMLADAALLDDPELPQIIAAAKDAAKAWRDQQAQQRASVADTEKQITQLLRRAQQALAGGQSRAAIGIRRSIDPKLAHLPSVPKHINERLQQLDVKLHELQDWKSFAVTPKRGELIEQMQALIGVDENPVQLAEQIRQLQEEWKALAKGSTDTEDDWTKFHEASQAAYQPCRVYFEAQSKLREANLQKRKALVARLKDYEASTDWDHVEWKHVANALRSAKQEWRDSGPTDRGPTKALEKSFDALLEKIQARLDAEYAANIEQKQSLVKQAQRLAAVTDLAQAANDVKRLQNAWRDVGLTPHAEGQRLWEEFKQLCDAVFDKRRQQHTERVAELKQSEGQAAALCVEAEEIAKRSGAELLAGAARIRELREAFAAVDLPRESPQSVQRRFRRALEQFENAIARQRQREADEAWEHLFEASNRVRLHQLEGSVPLEEIRAYLDAIKHWPKGGAQAIDRKLAQPASDSAANAAKLRELAIRAEIATSRQTPEEDQTQRRMMQLQALVNGTGRTTATPREQLEALAFEWIAVGPAPTPVYEALFARFQQAWREARGKN
jgi:hypothetical protein